MPHDLLTNRTPPVVDVRIDRHRPPIAVGEAQNPRPMPPYSGAPTRAQAHGGGLGHGAERFRCAQSRITSLLMWQAGLFRAAGEKRGYCTEGSRWRPRQILVRLVVRAGINTTTPAVQDRQPHLRTLAPNAPARYSPLPPPSQRRLHPDAGFLATPRASYMALKRAHPRFIHSISATPRSCAEETPGLSPSARWG